MAASAVNRPLLWRVSVTTTEEAEDAVLALLERLFNQIASAYTNEETHITQAATYLERPPEKSVLAEVAAGLKLIAECGFAVGAGRIEVTQLKRENWAESWKKHFKPIGIGSRLLIKPSWSRRKAKRGQAVVVLDPGLSFGTGNHATTSFCLRQLARARREGKRQSFLDVGTGSGILAIAAVKLGYSPVVAFDFDPEAVRVARANARVNRVHGKLKPAQQDLTKAPRTSRTRYDVVCANLIYDLLIAERERLLNRLAPEGRLILAGILNTQFDRVAEAYQAAGMKLIASRVEKEWRSGTFVRG